MDRIRPAEIHAEQSGARFWMAVGVLGAAVLLFFAATIGVKHLRWKNHFDDAEKHLAAARYTEAEREYRAALATAESFGERDVRLARTLHGLAKVYEQRWEPEQGVPFLARAVRIRESFGQPQDAELAGWLELLGDMYKDSGMYREAVAAQRKALAIWELKSGVNSQDVLRTLGGLTGALRRTGQLEEAESTAIRGLEVGKKLYGPLHPESAIGMNNLALVVADKGRASEAIELDKRARQILESNKRGNEGALAVVLNNLAALLDENDRSEEAEEAYRAGLEWRKQSDGPDSRLVASDLVDLGVFYINHDQNEKAEPLLRRAAEIQGRLFEDRHPVLCDTLYCLASALRRQDKRADAQGVYQRGLAACLKSHGPGSVEEARLLHGMAIMFEGQEQYEKAELHYQRALALYEKHAGKDEWNHPLALEHYADFLRKQKRPAEAVRFEAQAKALRAKMKAEPK